MADATTTTCLWFATVWMLSPAAMPLRTTADSVTREAGRVMAETSLPLRQARAVAAKGIARDRATKLAASVTALPPAQRGAELQRIASRHGADVARTVAKVAGLSTKLLALGGAR